MASDPNMPDTGWEIQTRQRERHRVPREARVWVDFDDPQGRRKRWRARIVDLSDGGLAFVCIGERPPVQAGIRLAGVVVHSGGWKIRGSMKVSHVTPVSGAEGSTPSGAWRVGGARFEPASEAEAVKLRTMIAGLVRRELG
jgi:c-di-GMP-binding flagellar brake protein YcgR